MPQRIKAPDVRTGHQSARPQLPARRSTTVPRVPAGMGPVARSAWRRLWRAGGSAYQPATDADVVEIYCALLQDRVDLRRLIAEQGFVVPGSPSIQPAARALSDVEKRLVSLSDRLGLNPDSRLRLGLTQAKVVNALEEFTADRDVA